MSDLHLEVSASMEQVVMRLKKLFPDLQFFFLMIPFHKEQVQHLSKEQMNELEKRVIRAANKEFERYLAQPDPLSEKV